MLTAMNGTGVRRGRAAAPALALVVLGQLLASACAGGPPTVPPSGVDELTIPTPSPHPDDFVAGVDNPWFPLRPGTVWTYRTTGDDGSRTDVVTVTHRTRMVAGVPTTVVHDVATDARGKVVEDTSDWYAQDRDGNVWYFGEDTVAYDGARRDTTGSWEAGVDGAEAGLAMPARPRLGDGYVRESGPGVAEDRVEVLSLDERRSVPFGTYDELLQTQDTTPLEPGLVVRTYYARGVGPVFEETVAGGAQIVELVGFTRG